MDILLRIQNDYLRFSPQEKKIADYILRYSESIQNMNINALSKKVQTSNATITRFAKKIGCESYADMKFQIHLVSAPKEKKTSKGIADDVFTYYQMVIKNTQNLIDMEKIDTFIAMVKKAKQIIIVGASSSGTTAGIFETRFMRMGFSVVSYSDPLWMKMRASIVNKGDLVIAISTSGTTDCIIDTLQVAKESGAMIASITGFSDNPISAISDLTLYVYSTRFIDNQKFINSQFSMMYLIDVITTYILEDKQLHDNMKVTRMIINDL